MKVLKCASCGAPFEEVPEDTAVECTFCGAINEPTIMQRPAPVQEVQAVQIVIGDVAPVARTVAKTGAAASCVGLVFTLAIIGVTAGGVWYGLRKAVPTKVPPLPMNLPFARKTTLASLGNYHDRGRTTIDVPAPNGGFARIDPVVQLPWATTIAQAWMQDARINRIDADRIRPDGTVDAAGDADAEVLYRFVSPSRIQAYWLDADTKGRVESEYEFWVIAKGGQPLVQLLRSRPSTSDVAPPAPEVLPLTSIFERSKRKLPARPLYRGYMIYSKGDGWVWYLSTLSGRDPIPRIRARDGRSSPW